jgi:exonuclease SbcC
MKITRLELENWMGIPRLALDFSQGINLIYGRNEIGKSSIIQSIRQALLGDPASKKPEYKALKPWGTDVSAHVKLFFTSHDGKHYRLCKSFPGGSAELYLGEIKITDEPKKTREKLFKILDISEKTTNLFHLLFIDQGESLNIFKKKDKENPLDENTKSYIKDVIKETAFKELQEFQDHLREELDQYLTASGKKVKSGSAYSLLLQKEETLARELEELQQKETQYREKLDRIENTGKEITGLEKEVMEKEKYLEALKKKKTRLDQIEKKEWDFKLVKNDYDDYIKISRELEGIRQRLPILWMTRQQRIDDLKKQLKQLDAEKKQSVDRLEQLKRKKQEGEKIQAHAREFENIKRDYEEVSKLEKQSSEIVTELPRLLNLHRNQLGEELQNITKKIQDCSQLKNQLSGIESKLNDFPKITQKDINGLRKLEKESEKLQTRLDSLREQLKLSFRLTPHTGREIPYSLVKDGGNPRQGVARQPLDIIDFQKLDFRYDNHLDIRVAGNLSETDFDALHENLIHNKHQLKKQMNAFSIDTIEALEEKYRQYNELKTRRGHLLEQLKASEGNRELEKQKKVILDNLEKLEQDLQKYLKKGKAGINTTARDTRSSQAAREVRDRLTAARTRLDSYRQGIDQVLAGRQCTFAELETQFKRQEGDLHQKEKNYRDMEPKTIAAVTQAHLDNESVKSNEKDKKINQTRTEIELLATMETLTGIHEPHKEVSLLTGYSSQQLRDDIQHSVNRRLDLEKQKKGLLGQRRDQEFKMNYFRRKDEIDTLKKEIKEIPPVEYNQGDKIAAEIQNTEAGIKRTTREKGEIEIQRERLSTETRDFSRVIEEKTDKEADYRKILENIRGHISALSSLRLLHVLIEEEREKAQQEVFRPLQDRVYQWFSTLVGERYRIGIDNDLNLEISGRTVTGDYLPGIDQVLSFGTREQLSFLFRLAIAAQLSRKEPVVMVLDDSFVNTDLGRLPLLLDLLGKRDTEIQFLVFTCRPGDYLSHLTHNEEKNFRGINLEDIIAPG